MSNAGKVKMQALLRALERDGFTVERLSLYALIHHDHHFICWWGANSPSGGWLYDAVRELVEDEFQDLCDWPCLVKTHPLAPEITKISQFLAKAGAHNWSLKLSREVEL